MSGRGAGYDGHKRTKGSQVHAAIDTLGQLLALRVTLANTQARTQVGQLADAVQVATGTTVELAWVDQGDTGDAPLEDAEARGIKLVMVGLPAATKGFVLLPRRWVIERSFAWATRFRRRANDDERLPATQRSLDCIASPLPGSCFTDFCSRHPSVHDTL